jgi:hypothetical protein
MKKSRVKVVMEVMLLIALLPFGLILLQAQPMTGGQGVMTWLVAIALFAVWQWHVTLNIAAFFRRA